MKLLYSDYCWTAQIYWSKLFNYDRFLINCGINEDFTFSYIIFGQYSKFSRRIFYIGKTYDQYIHTRISQKEHKIRIQTLRSKHPKFKFYICIGKLEIINGKISRKRIDQIESLLIFSSDSDYLINKNKVFSLRLKDHYKVVNHGYHKPLPKQIILGLFTQ